MRDRVINVAVILVLAVIATVTTPAATYGLPVRQDTVQIIIEWLDDQLADTVRAAATVVQVPAPGTIMVPAGPRAIEAFSTDSSAMSTLFGWIQVDDHFRLPIFVGVNSVPDLERALEEEPTLLPQTGPPEYGERQLTLFFLDQIGNLPNREIVTRLWSTEGPRILRIDPVAIVVRGEPLLQLPHHSVFTTERARSFRVRVDGPPSARSLVPFLVVRGEGRWLSSTLPWNRFESGKLSNDPPSHEDPLVFAIFLIQPNDPDLR